MSSHFKRDHKQMAGKHRKICSTSFIKERQSKTCMIVPFFPTRMEKLKKTILKANRDVGQPELIRCW